MLTLILNALLLHPVHETVTEVEWNETTGRLEVAVRLNALDEQWIRRWHSEDKRQDNWRLAYARRRILFADDRMQLETKQPVAQANDRYRWIGLETEGAHVWWYIEIEPASGKIPAWMSQTMLFRRDERYINRVVLLNRKPKRIVVFSAETPIAPVRPTESKAKNASNGAVH